MPFGKGRRKLWLVLGLLLVGIAAIWFGCPVWFPWVLQNIAPREGVHFADYERISYSRFSLRDLALTNESLVVHAQKTEALVPTVWLWRLVTGTAKENRPFVTITNWDLRLIPSDKPASPVFAKVQDVTTTLGLLGKWLPQASLNKGTVRSGDTLVEVDRATWNGKQLDAELKLPALATNESILAQLSQAKPFELKVRASLHGVDSDIVLSTNQYGLDIRTAAEWQTNGLELLAHFGTNDTLPQSATLQATNIRFSGALVQLPGYREITGSMSAQWQNPRFDFALNAAARPTAQETNQPPIDLDLRGHGDTNAITVQKLNIQLPFLQAQLSNEVQVALSAPYLRGSATLNLAANLQQQKWVPLSGKLDGQVDVRADPKGLPLARLRLSGREIGNNSLTADSVAVSANLAWPTLELQETTVRFNDGSTAAITAKVDLEKKTAEAGHFQFQGPLVQRWLPAGYTYNTLSVSADVHGDLTKPIHSGHLAISGMSVPELKPTALDLQWQGEAQTLQQFSLRLDQAKNSLSAAGALSVDQRQIQLRLTGLSLSTNDSIALGLAEPATIVFVPPQSAAGWRLQCAPLRWTGPAGELGTRAEVQWPNEGTVQFSLKNFGMSVISQFIQTVPPRVDVKNLVAALNWSNGPVNVHLDTSGTGLMQPPGSAAKGSVPQTDQEGSFAKSAGQLLETPLNFEININGDEHGLTLSNLVVTTSTSSVAVIRGFLPLTFIPTNPTNLINLASQTNLFLTAQVRPEAFFWKSLAEMSGVRLDEPSLDLNLSGKWEAPQGKIIFQARDIQLQKTNVPKLEDLRLSVSLNRDKAQITEGQVLVQGQRVSLTAELDMGEKAWVGLVHKHLPDWKKAKAQLRVQEAQLAAFEPMFPELLAPQGNLDLDLQLSPGARLEGAVIVRHARTRPLGNTAPLRDINVTLRFRDRFLTLENATADLSGAEVNLSGRVDLRGTNWLNGGLPPFNLALHGTNVPLTREPEYIIRSDLDLSIAKTNDAPPLVFGAAHLRNSYFLSDLSALVPGKVASPGSRPPYFSIDNPTLADCRLAVTVDGVRWLKVRTSLFNGEVSANLNLQGTLKEPLALGGLKIDSGMVRFPFANLQVKQGLVNLTSQDPYHPQLLVRAASKQFGYDIRMEVTGPVDAPVIQFTSNPSLTSEQILLMITAGQLPPGAFTLTPQQRAQTVALFLGKDLLAKLGFGDQSQERLTISSGEEISEQGRPTYHVEYKLTKRWSVEGEYDRFGDFNAGLKWRIYSK